MTRPLSISNIAWPAEHDDEALTLIRAQGFTGVELAPRKVFGPLDQVAPGALRDYRSRCDSMGLGIPALQGLLFGVEGVALFGDDAGRAALLAALSDVAVAAGLLGAHACVFGAPKLRDPGALAPDAAFDLAVGFFRRVGEIYAGEGTALTFEANAEAYGCRFVTRTEEAIDFVAAVGSPGLRLQIDTGTMFMNGEDPSVIGRAVPYAGHFHASEPQLAPLGTGGDHAPIAAALNEAGYDGSRSVEMRIAEDWRGAVIDAARLMNTIYG